MRLKPEEAKIIKDAVLQLDPTAQVFLFGSRVDPHRKGGDIDILVLSNVLKEINAIEILKLIYESMEEQKIDVLITSDIQAPFVKIALENGIKL